MLNLTPEEYYSRQSRSDSEAIVALCLLLGLVGLVLWLT